MNTSIPVKSIAQKSIPMESTSVKSLTGNFQLATRQSVATTHLFDEPALPEQLIYPLRHRHVIRAPAVSVGEQVLKGQRLDHGLSGMASSAAVSPTPPLLASTSGTVVAIETRAVAHPHYPHDTCIVIESDGLEKWSQEWSGQSCDEAYNPDAWNTLSIREKIARIDRAAISGLGGASYSCAHKLQCFIDHKNKQVIQPAVNRLVVSADTSSGPSTAEPSDSGSLLIINAVECEPLIQCDAALLHNDLETVLAGIECVLDLCKADQCILAIEDDHPAQQEQLQAALSQRPQRAAVITLVTVPAKYPSGAEKQLIEILTGVRLARDSNAASLGILCFNVATVHAIQHLATTDQPPLSRIVTVQQEFSDPPENYCANVRARFGTPIESLLKTVQAGVTSAVVGAEVQKDSIDELDTDSIEFTLGGELSGYTFPDLAAPVTEHCNCVQVFVKKTAQRAYACIRCGECSAVCPAALLPQQLHWYASSNDLSNATRFNLASCIECGCCDAVCPSHIPLTAQFRRAKHLQRQQSAEQEKAALARQRFENREVRLAQLKTERAARLEARKSAVNQSTSAAKTEIKSDASDKLAAKSAVADAMERIRRKKDSS